MSRGSADSPPPPERPSSAPPRWLVMHQDERHDRAVRRVADAITALLKAHAPLFRGEQPYRA